MRILKKSLVLFFTLTLLLSTACSGDTSWVYEYNGSKITSGMYINYLVAATSYMQEEELAAHEGEEDYTIPGASEYLKGSTNGISNSQIAKERAALLCAEYFAINNRFNELGLSLSDGETAYLSAYTDSIMGSYSSYFEANGIGRGTILEYQTSEYMRSMIFSTLYSEGGEFEVPKQDITDKFVADYIKVEVAYYTDPAAEYGLEEPDEEFKQEVDNLFKRYENGESLVTVDYDMRKILAETYASGEDVVAAEKESLYRIIDITTSSEDDEVFKSIMSAQVGKPTLIYDNSVYYIYTKLDILEDPADLETYKETVIVKLKSDEFNDYISGLANALNLTENPTALSRYAPEKIKITDAE